MHHSADKYVAVRNQSQNICARLEREDMTVQPCAEVSPPKWHLAHTTWFFEEMILRPFADRYQAFDDSFSLLFNSYYKGAGQHWLQSERGNLSRPTVGEILRYRQHVDTHILELLKSGTKPEILTLINLGLHHEQQHQELLYMDIKYILGINPSLPAYETAPLEPAPPAVRTWMDIPSGVFESGYSGEGFSFDNEKPRHRNYIHSCSVADAVVTNGQFRAFIEDGGYEKASLWLSSGWDWVEKSAPKGPLYWHLDGKNGWREFTLHGAVPLDPNAPVTHINYFEADAFATWAGARLPTEHELEQFLLRHDAQSSLQDSSKQLHPSNANTPSGQVWTWTSSHYSAYPGFKPFAGLASEYNGKFMCGQFVLRGGCVTTPKNHYRPSYRNFYLPHQRWMFSGIRLSKDL